MDPGPLAPGAATRLIAMGRAPLMEGFRLVGLETYPDADAATVERVLAAIALSGEHALVLLEHSLARSRGEWLERLRSEGGRVVVTEIPPLAAPGAYAPTVDALVRSVLGPGALDDHGAAS